MFTSTTIVAYPDFFAAVAPSGNSTGKLAYTDEAIASVDLPVYETACSMDLYMTRSNPNRFSSFARINSHLALNNIDVQLGSDTPDYNAYPFYGFDIFTTAETTTTYTYHGVPFNVSTFRNEAGVPLVKFRVAVGMNHNHYTEFAADIWDFFKDYSRDPETKEVIYNAPDQLVGETADAKCGEGETAVVDITYDSEITATTLRFQLDTELDILNVTSDYDMEFNSENGMVIVYSVDGINNGDVVCSVTFDLDVSPWLKNGNYYIPINIIEATDADDEIFEISSVPAAVKISNEYLIGDVNCDGVISNADVVELARYLVDLTSLDSCALANADVNGDGIVSNIDLVKLVRMLVA